MRGRSVEPDLGPDRPEQQLRGVVFPTHQPERLARRGDARRAQQPQHLAEPLHRRDRESGPEVRPILDAALVRPRAQRLEAQPHADAALAALGRRLDEARVETTRRGHPGPGYRGSGVRAQRAGVYCPRTPRLAPARPPRRDPMFDRPRNTALACLLFAAVAGYFVTGHYLYKVPIGLDESAFLLGEPLQALAMRVAPDLQNATSGAILLVLSLLAIAAVRLLRDAPLRAREGRDDRRGQARVPDRRRLGRRHRARLARVAGGAGAARGFLGVGLGHDGWRGVAGNIGSSEGIVTTNPEWKEAWKGARVKGYRRLGRTGWNVSDIVLGTGRIRGEDGEQIARLAIDRGVNYFDTSPDYSGSRQRAGHGPRHSRCARPALHRHQVLHADGAPAAGYAGGEVHGRRRGQPRDASARTTSISVTCIPATRSSG